MMIGGGGICAMAPLADKSRIVVSPIVAARFVVMAESYVLLRDILFSPEIIRHTLRQIAALSVGQRFQTAGRARASSRFASASRSDTNVLVGIISISNNSTFVRIVFNFSTCFFVICVVSEF